ncbi:hypothetical protein HOLleu_21545 [Holothuria leucospilota]|uniref:SRCR domain-containing protein n=1 Tax=Holothuria leucospilota TaxID=206669 RepID=A0A9Q1BXT6_HOLLE|nr:hypothetical protein HOLleu_21545 [Holothuria leucospilota]
MDLTLTILLVSLIKSTEVDAENFVQDVHLVDGYSNSSGRVEGLIGEMWRPTCSKGWDLLVAGKVCRYLGYHTAVAVLVVPFLHESSEIVWMEHFQCSGSKVSLSECRQIPVDQYYCFFNVLGVVCGVGTDNVPKDVRLAEGYSNSSGRVEVFIDGEWAAVCTDGWTIADASVVCRQLGYKTAVAVLVLPALYYQPGPVWVDDVNCSGNETSLFECKRAQIGQHDCSIWYSTGIVCGAGTENVIKDVRLAEGYSNSSGRVEVLIDEEWAAVCTDGWTIADASVVCKQLGYQTAITVLVVPALYYQLGPIWVDDVNCSGSETSLFECKKIRNWHHDCSFWENAGVVCGVNRENVIQNLRLVQGVAPWSNSSGRLEVFFNNEWGTICNDGWDLVDATVVCRELGYPEVLTIYQNAFFGNASGYIWLTNVQCNGNESSLSECQHEIFAEPQCSHHQDVGVLCGGEIVVLYY